MFNGKNWAHLILQRQEDPEAEQKTTNPDPNIPEPPPPTINIVDGLYGPGDTVEGFYRFKAD
jgi:hypothetical protein